jgi:hypothetical protein
VPSSVFYADKLTPTNTPFSDVSYHNVFYQTSHVSFALFGESESAVRRRVSLSAKSPTNPQAKRFGGPVCTVPLSVESRQA